MTKLSGAMETAIKHSLDIQAMKYSPFLHACFFFLLNSQAALFLDFCC